MILNNLVSARNFLEYKKIEENNKLATDVISFINVKFVRKDENFKDKDGKPKSVLMLKDVIEDELAYDKFPILREDLRKDIHTFFNTQLTNLVNRNLIGRYGKIVIIDGEPHQSHIAIENYTEDIFDLVKISRENELLNKVVNTIKIEQEVQFSKNSSGEEIDAHFNRENFDYLTGPDGNENTMALVFVNTFRVLYTKRSNVPEALGNIYKPYLLRDIRDVFPACSIGQLDYNENEMIVITDDNFYMLGKTGYDNTALRMLHPLELFDYSVFKYRLKD